MNTNLVGSHWLLATWNIGITSFLLYMVTIGVIFVLRDRGEGFFYNTSYSAMLGDGALVSVVIMAAGILQRGVLPPEWSQGRWFHIVALALALTLGIIWWARDAFDKKRVADYYPIQWGDIYHHLVIAPLLCYLLITLLPVIFKNGMKVEVETVATVCFVALWVALCIYDGATHRLDQRNYHGLGRHLDAVDHSKSVTPLGFTE